MKLKIVVCFFLVFGMCACRKENHSEQAGVEKERQAHAILKKVAAQLKQETDLCPIGTIGQMLSQIEVLGLSFFYYHSVDIAAGRQLLIKATSALMNAVNQEKKIRSYLCYYPFVSENIEIRIILRTPDGKEVPSGKLWVVIASEGMLNYKIQDSTKGGLVTIYRESYEQALERMADPSLPLVPFEPDKEMSQEELARLRKGVSIVEDNGSIWHLNEKGAWASD